MLSHDDVAFIAEHLESVDQDYYVQSGIWGEPFLWDGVLSYFDGETVQVVGSPMGCPRPGGSALVGAVIAEWARDERVRFVNYFGPYDLSQPGPDWTAVYSSLPRPWTNELFTSLPHRCRPDVIRRCQRRGYETWIGRRDFLTHQHIRLLRALARRETLGVSDVGCLVNVVSVLRGEVTTVFEAHAGGELAGFLVTHEFFPGRPLAVIAAFDGARPGVSDLLYHLSMRYYADRGAREIGVGYSHGEGLFRYKAKWGISRQGPPSYQFIWQRADCGEPFNDCLYWPWRILTGKLPPGVQAEPILPGAGGVAESR